MRVAMVSGHGQVAELSAALAGRGHDVTVYTRRDDPTEPEITHTPAGYRVVRLAAGPATSVPTDELLPHLNDFVKRLIEHAWTDRPDVLHGHFWMAGMVASLAGRVLEVPMVQSFHGLGTVRLRHLGRADTGPRSRIAVERAIGRSADRVVAGCGAEAFELARMGVPRYKVSVVPAGVDLDRFTPDGPQAARGSAPRVVSVGKLVPRKGFTDLIAALPLVPDAELVIVGGPDAGLEHDPEASRLRFEAAKLGVEDRVRLTGRVARADLPALLRSADLVACVPWYEPFGVVALEAMACGVPVLASAVGGLTDTVIDGVTGVLVPPRDVRALGRAMRRLLADETERGMLAAAGCDRARVRYTWDRIALDTERVYLSVVEHSEASAAGKA